MSIAPQQDRVSKRSTVQQTSEQVLESLEITNHGERRYSARCLLRDRGRKICLVLSGSRAASQQPTTKIFCTSLEIRKGCLTLVLSGTYTYRLFGFTRSPEFRRVLTVCSPPYLSFRVVAPLSSALRSQTIAPGKVSLTRIDCDIKLSLVVLDEKLVNQERCSIKIVQHDPEAGESMSFVLANLIPGKVRFSSVLARTSRLTGEIFDHWWSD